MASFVCAGDNRAAVGNVLILTQELHKYQSVQSARCMQWVVRESVPRCRDLSSLSLDASILAAFKN